MVDQTIGQPPSRNPTYVPVLASWLGDVGNVVFLAGLGVLAAAGASVLIRLRRATGEERLSFEDRLRCAFAMASMWW